MYNVIDNVATKAIKTYLESEKIEVQFVTPYDHRVNAAERAIQTFKNHTISGLCICDDEFPSILWCKNNKTSTRYTKYATYLEGTSETIRFPCVGRPA